jgi:hypothetical protein
MTLHMEIVKMQKPLVRIAMIALCALMILGAAPPAYAQFNSGSTGANGVFPPVPQNGMPADAVYILWNVRTGLVRYCNAYALLTGSEQCDSSSSTNVTAQIPGIPSGGVVDGIYHFTDVNITAPAGARYIIPVGYSPNVPLSILSQGDITILGGGNQGTSFYLQGTPGKGPSGSVAGFSVVGGRGGPGGFDGGASGNGGLASANGNAGFGPAGGSGGPASAATAPGTYGVSASGNPLNPSLTPLSGGSGGGGAAGIASGALGCDQGPQGFAGGSGGGGGGALLLAATGRITIAANAFILANGGTGGANVNTGCRLYGGGGAGGSVRLVASEVTGTGSILVGGGFRGDGGARAPGGFVRIETGLNSYTGAIDNPSGGSFISFPTAPVPATQPLLRITSVGGSQAPASATATLVNPDVTFANPVVTPVALQIAASNVPLGTTINIKVVPANGEPTTAVSSGLSGTLAASTAQATVTLPPGAGIISASATFNISAGGGGGGGGGDLALNALPLIDGERPQQMEVVATADGRTRTYLIARSGARFEVGQALK